MYRSYPRHQIAPPRTAPQARKEGLVKTVWVLDREHRTRELIKDLLSPAGYSVELFERPKSLFDRRLPQNPWCLVVDYGVAGVWLPELLSSTDLHIPISIIFLSHILDLPTVVKAIRSGGFEFLLKPIDSGRLLEAVQGASDNAQQRWTATSRNRELKKKYETLTKRERQVLPYVVSGFLNKQTAFELGASEVTIRIHRGQIMRKMGAATFADLVKSAARIGIVDF